jgi:hypothetical protein
MNPLSWIVPLVSGPSARIRLASGHTVQLEMPMPTHATTLTAMEAAQLGQALLDASREAGARKARTR